MISNHRSLLTWLVKLMKDATLVTEHYFDTGRLDFFIKFEIFIKIESLLVEMVGRFTKNYFFYS